MSFPEPDIHVSARSYERPHLVQTTILDFLEGILFLLEYLMRVIDGYVPHYCDLCVREINHPLALLSPFSPEDGLSVPQVCHHDRDQAQSKPRR